MNYNDPNFCPATYLVKHSHSDHPYSFLRKLPYHVVHCGIGISGHQDRQQALGPGARHPSHRMDEQVNESCLRQRLPRPGGSLP